jgi:signal transduction histidine kinase
MDLRRRADADSAPEREQGGRRMAEERLFEVPPYDEAGYLILDGDWHVIAADDSGALTTDAGASLLLGRHVRDVIGPEAFDTLRTRRAATLTLDNVAYVLTATAFDLHDQVVWVVRAQEMQATLEHVISLIVHEVRNPLSAMRALVQGLEEELGGQQACLAYTSRLTGEIDRLSRLLGSMSQVARLRARPPELLEPAAVLQRAAEVFRPELARRGIQLQVAVTPRAAPILADPDQVQQVLVNLVKNAADAMPSGGAITLRARLDARGRTVLQVEDTGVGMDAEALERALRPRQSSKPGGMGLGLMIVRGIVRQLGGRLRVASTAGRGTTISITFPLLPDGTPAG